MVRSYKKVRPKKHSVYSVKDVERLYQVTANTVSNWVRAGLSTSDRERPHLFRGAELIRFHEDRRNRSRQELRTGEAYCVVCKSAVLPILETLTITRQEGKSPFMCGQCCYCGATLFKRCSEADTTFFEGVADPNMSNDPSDEEIAQAAVGIGITATTVSKPKGTLNDRIIFEWQSYAGKFDQKTVDQHIRAIRYMEDTLDRMSFRRLRKSDIARVRDDLKQRVSSSHDRALSKSTVKHLASHIKAFLRWLVQQDGYKRLPADLAEYMELPKAFFEGAFQRDGKTYPTIEQAAQMVNAMPSSTILERRDQAMVALAFLGALRADTLVSLLIKHIDVDNRQVIQDASVSRTKNGKSLTVSWFTVPNCFHETVNKWLVELNAMGFGPNDALFPSAAWFEGKQKPGAKTCAPMCSAHAVTTAFRRASKFAPAAYTPHTAKHTIAALRDELPLTQRQRKAWSANMGHECETTTEKHYGKISDEDRLKLMESIDYQADPRGLELTDEQKIAIVDGVMNGFKARA